MKKRTTSIIIAAGAVFCAAVIVAIVAFTGGADTQDEAVSNVNATPAAAEVSTGPQAVPLPRLVR
jgi:hypothetical protein